MSFLADLRELAVETLQAMEEGVALRLAFNADSEVKSRCSPQVEGAGPAVTLVGWRAAPGGGRKEI